MTKNKNHSLNFGSGPAALPPEVLAEASEAIINYNHTGLSILEIPHRGKLFDTILEESKSLVKELCGLHEDYEVLWMQGGGRLQFAMIPMNFLGEGESAGYIDSGHWAYDAMQNAQYYGNTISLSSSRADNYKALPEWPASVAPDLSYVHFTSNNTIYGTQWHDIGGSTAPLIADMSSDIFSRKRDYTKCSMFYAVAQKNIGPAGVTLVVVHKELLQKIKRVLPPMLDYGQHARHESVLNTPPVFAIYTSMLTLRWIKQKGIDNIERENNRKAALLYNEIERNTLLYPVVKGIDRSCMNVVFRAHDTSKEQALIDFCAQQNITGIAGHRSVGGFRVSLYNAIPVSAVEELIAVLKEFEKISS